MSAPHGSRASGPWALVSGRSVAPDSGTLLPPHCALEDHALIWPCFHRITPFVLPASAETEEAPRPRGDEGWAMAKTLNDTLVPAERHGSTRTSRVGPRTGGRAWPAAVAAAFTLAQLVLVRPGMGLGWDETVYVSQVGAHAPAAFFSAPRARGVPLLVAPIAVLVVVHRTAAGLSGGAVRARPLPGPARLARTLPGPRARRRRCAVRHAVGDPLLRSAGHAQLLGRDRRPGRASAASCGPGPTPTTGRPCGASGAGAALMAWMRPTDAVWVDAAAVRRCGVRPAWRRPAAAALVGGPGGRGGAEWVSRRTSATAAWRAAADASRIQGGLGWNIAVDDQLRSLGGRTLCRPCTGSIPDPAMIAWWFVLPLLAAVGLAVAVRARRTARTLLPLACAATAAIPYLFMIGYAAPRFLLPAYALLAIPVADALLHLVTASIGKWRPVAAALVALGLAGHLAVQYAVLDRTVDRTTATAPRLGPHRGRAAPPRRTAALPADRAPGHPYRLLRGLRLRRRPSGHNANTTAADIAGAAQRLPVAALTTPKEQAPEFARTWEQHRVAGLLLHVAPTAR